MKYQLADIRYNDLPLIPYYAQKVPSEERCTFCMPDKTLQHYPENKEAHTSRTIPSFRSLRQYCYKGLPIKGLSVSPVGSLSRSALEEYGERKKSPHEKPRLVVSNSGAPNELDLSGNETYSRHIKLFHNKKHQMGRVSSRLAPNHIIIHNLLTGLTNQKGQLLSC